MLFKKGLIFVRGDIIGDITKSEANIVFSLTQQYYIDPVKYRKVIEFNQEPRKFNFEEHIDNCLKYFP